MLHSEGSNWQDQLGARRSTLTWMTGIECSLSSAGILGRWAGMIEGGMRGAILKIRD